jgi:hypothetical protein
MTDDIVKISPGPRFLAAMVLAVAADALQILVMPFFAEGDGLLNVGKKCLFHSITVYSRPESTQRGLSWHLARIVILFPKSK